MTVLEAESVGRDVTNAPDLDRDAQVGSRFDWYEATFEWWEDAAAPLAVVLGTEMRPGRGRNGYATCVELVRGEDVLASVYTHGQTVGEVHVSVTGASCDEVVPLLRRLWPEHRVSRVDAAVDLLGDFDELDGVAVEFARERGLSHRLITDSEGGATRYLGARSSAVVVRVYKKSEQLRALHPERASEVPSGVVRVEVQVRPGKRAAKAAAAKLRPDDVWGMSRWGAELAGRVLGLRNVQRTSVATWKASSWERGAFFLVQQYGPLLRSRAAQVGWDAVLGEVRQLAEL